MSRTKKCNIKIKSLYHFIRKFGRGKKYYPLLLSISENYRKYFPIELPYEVTVEEHLCGIKSVKFEQDDYSITFERPWFECTDYIFTSITEHKFSTLAAKKQLVQTKRWHNKGFFFYISCSGPKTLPRDITFPYKPLFEGITVEFKHVYTKLPMLRYMEACENMLSEISQIFEEGRAFKFGDLLNIVLNAFDISVAELEELEIPDILLYSQGTFHRATSYNGEYLTMMSQTEEKFLSPMCRYVSSSISATQDYVSKDCALNQTIAGKKRDQSFGVNIEPISKEDSDALYVDAKKHLDDFLKEVEFFNTNCSKESKSLGG